MRCSLALLTATASLAAAVCLAPASAALARGRGGARTAALAMAEGMGRRTALRLAGAAAAAGASAGPEAVHASLDGTEWPLWPALPLAPYGKRKTLRRDVGPGVWAFEQLLGIFYVHVPIRMTVVRMVTGGLFVYAPVAPTVECLALLQPLIDAHGPVRYIILPSVAPEHKVFAGPFARRFPSAEVFATDRQYSFPLNLPASWLGFPPRRVRPLPPSSQGAGQLWGGEFEHEVLTAKASASSVYQDAAFFHKPSGTLLVCDALIATTAEPPPILTAEPEHIRALLYHARDDPLELVRDTPETRRKGWQRIALFANFFMPGSLVKLPQQAYYPPSSLPFSGSGPKSPMPELGWAGVLPFAWRDSTGAAFDRFSAGGKPTVAPIIQIIMSRAPSDASRWVSQLQQWDFERVIPAHFDAPINIGPKALDDAFAFLSDGKNEVRFCDEDVFFLRDSLEGLPANLALYPTPLGPLQGKDCRLGLRKDFAM